MSTVGSPNPFASLRKHEIALLKRFTPEEQVTNRAKIEQLMASGNTPEQRAKSGDVSASAVFRDQSGKVLAIQYADGGTYFRPGGAAMDAKDKAVNDPRVERMPMAQQVDYYTKVIAQAFGSDVTVERYSGSNAPRRGSIQNGVPMDPRLADRPDRSPYSAPPFG